MMPDASPALLGLRRIRSRLLRAHAAPPGRAASAKVGTACRGCSRSSTRTVIDARRSASLSVALTSCSMSTGQRCVTSPGSARSSPRRSSARSATRVGSRAGPSRPLERHRRRSRCHPAKAPTNRSATGSISAATAASTACCTSSASLNNATIPPRVAISHARPQKARLDENPDAPTNASSPTASSAACGATNTPAAIAPHSRQRLDKGASDTPWPCAAWTACAGEDVGFGGRDRRVRRGVRMRTADR